MIIENNFSKKLTAIAMILIVGIVALSFYLISKRSPNDNVGINNQSSIPTMSFVYSPNGEVELVRMEDGERIDSIHLDNFTQEAPEVLEVEETKPKEREVFRIEEYLEIERVIEKGDNTWTIQKEFTPERNTHIMLSYLEERNGGRFLHPVYPGETRIFLIEIEDADKYGLNKDNIEVFGEDRDLLLSKEEEAKLEELDKYEALNQNQIEGGYLFARNNQTLVASNPKDGSLFYLEEKDGKINVDLSEHRVKDTDFIEVFDGNIYLTSNKTNKMSLISSKTDKLISERTFNKKVENIKISETSIIYSNDEYIYIIDKENGTEKEVFTGGVVIDLAVVNDKAIAINNYGNDAGKSVLLEIDASSGDIGNIQEVASRNVFLVSNNDKDSTRLFVGASLNTKSSGGGYQDIPSIQVFDTGSLRSPDVYTHIPYNERTVKIEDIIYYYTSDGISLMSSDNGSNLGSIDTKDSNYLISPIL